jgi:hypothetical protein
MSFWVDAVVQCQPQCLGGFLRPLGIGDIDGGQGQLRILVQDGRQGDDVHAVNRQQSTVRGNQVRHVAVALDGFQQGHLGTVGLGVGIGAVLEQHLHHRQIVLFGRGHEGKGEIVVVFLGVGIGARGQEQRDDVAPAELGRARQRPLLARRLKMDRAGVRRQQRPDLVDVALDAGEIDVVRGAAGQQQLEQALARTGVGIAVIAKQRDIDRREAEVVRDVERSAVVEQERHERGAVGRVLRLPRPVQRRVAVLVGGAHGRRIAPDFALDGGQVALAQRGRKGLPRAPGAVVPRSPCR